MKTSCKSDWQVFFFFILQALCGARAEIPLLGGERMVVNLQDEVVQPNTVKRIVGKGLPNPKDVNRKGDLIVNFDIQFPERLSDHLKDLFRKYLPGWNPEDTQKRRNWITNNSLIHPLLVL